MRVEGKMNIYKLFKHDKDYMYNGDSEEDTYRSQNAVK